MLHRGFCLHCRLGRAPALAPLQPDHRISNGQCRQCGRSGDKGVGPEIQTAGLADQNVLRITNQARGGAGIARQCQGQEKGPRIEATGQQAMAQQWGQGKGDDVIDQQRRQHAAQQNHAQQQQRRLLGIVAELLVKPGVHAGEVELRTDQHQRQQQ